MRADPTSSGTPGSLFRRPEKRETVDLRSAGPARQGPDGAGPAPSTGQNRGVHIPAKVDYGMRALLALTARGEPTTAEALAEAQALPSKFLAPS